MAILWCGGEDVDFSLGSPVTVSLAATHFRAGYARCTVMQATSGALSKGSIFPGGAVTSAWLSARMVTFNNGAGNCNLRIIGFGLSGTNKGLFIGTDSSNGVKLVLCKYDGTTHTQLAAESGTSISAGAISAIQRLDMEVVNYGATATVKVYLDRTLLITFTGDVTVSGMSNFDSVFLARSASSTAFSELSEIIVADEDLRAFPGLVTLALTGAGATDDWTGVYSTINQTTLSDANPNYVDINTKDQQFNITDLPSGAFIIKAVKIAARAAKAAGTPTQIALGYNSGGSVAVGSDIALATAYATYESLDSINPVTAAAFVQSEMNALQVDVRSKA